MKLLLTFCFAMLVTAGISQSAKQYFNKIRNNEAALTAFFSMMPKGGDLHHHYSGSVYAETFLQHAIAEDFYVNTETLRVEKESLQTVHGSSFQTYNVSVNLIFTNRK
jgi:adenosine deaminase/adenosine deaminase CECR1